MLYLISKGKFIPITTLIMTDMNFLKLFIQIIYSIQKKWLQIYITTALHTMCITYSVTIWKIHDCMINKNDVTRL